MKIVFMGTPKAAVPSLERLVRDGHDIVAVYCQPDRPSGRGNKISFSPVKRYALDQGLTVLQPSKIRNEESIAKFRSHNADVAVVVAYGRILPDEFLDACPLGAVNVHFSLLPKYRGAAPVNWAIVNGETETGVTTMLMDSGLDSGPILLQRRTGIGEKETAVELTGRLAIIGADLLAKTLDDIDSIRPQIQDAGLATLAPILKRDDGRIDWKMTSKQISDRVRGFQPFPGSFTSFDGRKMIIIEAEAMEAAESTVADVVSGSLIITLDRRLIAICGEATQLLINELQLEGKRPMSSAEFINGFRPATGTVLG